MDTNQVIIYGRVGKDPELRETPNGDAIVSFAIANSTFKKDSSQQSGWKEETSWFDCTMFGDAAKRFVERTKKGHAVIVSGNLKQRRWKDKDDKWQERVNIQVRGVQFLEKKPKGNQQEQQPQAEPTEDVPF